jgi:hypothetical protein
MAQWMINPDIIYSFYSARMEVEEWNLERYFGVRHAFKYHFSLDVKAGGPGSARYA